ncbi:hypothetical protein, partial [Methylocapsa palsarum]|uniref:hypothetical protein n=1 Tax=Methylocapsa palsarum TaxID=1612308 RepID=UPI001113FC52
METLFSLEDLQAALAPYGKPQFTSTAEHEREDAREIISLLSNGDALILKAGRDFLAELSITEQQSCEEQSEGRARIGLGLEYHSETAALELTLAGILGEDESAIRKFYPECPSSDDLRQFQVIRNGGSGSSTLKVKRPAVGA